MCATDLDGRIDAWVGGHVDELVELAQTLVRHPTESDPPTGHERTGQTFIEARMREYGADVDVFSPADVPELIDHPAHFPTINGEPRELSDRPNVVGVFRGAGGGRSLILSTHIDTVPAGRGWSVGSPFGGEVVDGRLYGRGAYDTKCALASHLMAIRCLRELGAELAGDLTVESVVDEEYGGSHGVLAARLRGYNADLAINSEPTHLAVCPVHRGGREAYLRLRGRAGMAFGGEEAADAAVGLARAIVALKAFDDERNRAAPPALYAEEPRLPWYFNQVGGGGTTYREAVGTPGDAYVHFWAEVYPGVSADAFDEAVLGCVADELARWPETAGLEVQLDRTIRFLPGSAMALDHEALAVLEDAYRGVTKYVVRGAPFACDAYVFNLHSPTPALILGPGGAAAHAPDEYVEIDDLVDLAKICARFAWRWCGSAD